MVRPTQDRLLIREEDPRTLSPGSFHSSLAIADGYEDDVISGTVVAAGPGMVSQRGEKIPVRCAVGQRVLFHPSAGDNEDFNAKFSDETGNYRIIRDGDVGMRLE